MQTTGEPTRVLLVDDERQQFLLIGYLLSQCHDNQYRLIWCKDLEDGLNHIEHSQCDVVLLDYHWGASGKNFIYQANLLNKRIPIIVMTDRMEREVDYRAISEGASDYLIKDRINSEIIERTIRYSMERKKIERHLDHLAHYDHLTSLPNRILFLDRLNQAISLGHRANHQFTLMYIDLNDFKEVNDNYGHDMGDRLLQQFASRLQANVRRSDTVARIGGDEFTVLLNNIGSTPKIISLAQKLVDSIGEPFPVDGMTLSVGCSIGIAVFPEAGDTVDTLQRHADMAMYQAKQSGFSAYRFYSQEQLPEQRPPQWLSPSQLQSAIYHHDIALRFSPRVNAKTGSVEVIEARAMWATLAEGDTEQCLLVNPNNREATQLLSQWMLKQAFSLLVELYRQHKFIFSFSMATCQLRSPQFNVYVKAMTEEYDIDARHIEFSLTQTSVDASQRHIMDDCLDSISDMGAASYLENIGQNMPSIVDIHQQNISSLQLEQQLWKPIMDSDNEPSLISGLVDLAHQWQRKIIAAGVENQDQLQWLSTLHCDQVKGKAIGENFSIEQLKRVISKKNITIAS